MVRDQPESCKVDSGWAQGMGTNQEGTLCELGHYHVRWVLLGNQGADNQTWDLQSWPTAMASSELVASPLFSFYSVRSAFRGTWKDSHSLSCDHILCAQLQRKEKYNCFLFRATASLIRAKILNSCSVDRASSSAVHPWLLWAQPWDQYSAHNDLRAPSASGRKGCCFPASGFSENPLDNPPGHQICAGRIWRAQAPAAPCTLLKAVMHTWQWHYSDLLFKNIHQCSWRCSHALL